MLNVYKTVSICLVSSVLVACGGGSGGSDDQPPPAMPADPSSDITVNFVKGAVSGGSCSVFEIATDGSIVSPALATATTGADGTADFSDVPYEGTALIVCDGGSYSDEASDATLTAPEMRAVFDTENTTTVVVSPITEIATQLAENDAGGILTALTLYNSGNDLGINATTVVPTNLQVAVTEDTDESRYAVLLALFSQLAFNLGADTPEELTELVEDFANDLITDQQIAAAAEDLANSASVAANNIGEASLNSVIDDLDVTTNTPGEVLISGTPLVGNTLSATVNDGDGTSTSNIVYQWQRIVGDLSTTIPSASDSTLLLTADELGAQILVNVAYIDDNGFEEQLDSDQTTSVETAPTSGGGGNFPRGTVGNDDSVPQISCDTVITTTSALEEAATREMTPGTTLCLADGNYTGLELDFGGQGTAEALITVAAQNPGEAIIGGEVSVRMSGNYIMLQGLVFLNGESASSDFLQTRGGNNEHCFNCRITEIAVINLDDSNSDSGKWIQMYGQNNRVDHSWFSGKTNAGALLTVVREIPDDGALADVLEDNHVIDHNYFGDRTPTDGKAYAANSDNEFEAIRLGTSEAHSTNSFTRVEHNYFERIDGEAEVISNKSGNNTIFNNTVRDSYGSITSRHGSSATIANNFMIGDGHPFAGGLRLVDDGHRVINNYIEGARYLSTRFHGGIVLHNSDGSTTNGYQVFENVLVAHNTITDSVNSLNVNGGNQSANPTDVRFVNNIIDDAVGPIIVLVDEGMPADSVFAGNYVEGNEFSDEDDLTSFTGFTQTTIDLEDDMLGIARPSASSAAMLAADTTADISPFSSIDDDMDGQMRSGAPTSGADEDSADAIVYGVLTSEDVGPIGYRPPVTGAIVDRIPLANANFEDGNTGWTITSDAEITTLDDEVFAGDESGKITGTAGRIGQTVTLQANTNYALTAFTQGPLALGADLDGVEVTGDFNNSNYRFSQFEFNTGSTTSVTIFANQDDMVENNVEIQDADFSDFNSSAAADNPWVIVEGGTIGQVQRSGNSASGADGSLRFRYNTVDENGSPMVSQVLTGIQPNTDYELSAWVLADDGITGTMGIYEGETTTVLTSKLLDFDALESADAPEGDDSFREDTLSFNSGANTTLTLFIIYTANTIHIENPEIESSGNIGNSDLRIDDIALTFEGAPSDDAESFVDDIRLVSFPGSN